MNRDDGGRVSPICDRFSFSGSRTFRRDECADAHPPDWHSITAAPANKACSLMD